MRAAERAAKANDRAVEALLRQLASALEQKDPHRAWDPARLQKLRAQQAKLKQSDGFGGGAKRALPAEIDQALAALVAVVPQKARPGFVEEEELSDAERELLEMEAEYERELAARPPGYEEIDETEIRDEVEARLVAGFETPEGDTRTEEQILADLPQSVRQKMLALSKEERLFLFYADTEALMVHGQLSAPEQAVFVQLDAEQRATWLVMRPDEKQFVEKLDKDARRYFLRLNPENRDQFRRATPSERQARLAEAKKAQEALSKKSPDDAARTLVSRIFDDLGLVPAWYPELYQRASALAFNYLRENRTDEGRAHLGTLRILLDEPDVIEPLLDDLEAVLGGATENELTPMSRGGGAISPLLLAEHFVRIRQELYGLIKQVAQPGLTRNALTEALKKCVLVSASVALSRSRKPPVASS